MLFLRWRNKATAESRNILNWTGEFKILVKWSSDVGEISVYNCFTRKET